MCSLSFMSSNRLFIFFHRDPMFVSYLSYERVAFIAINTVTEIRGYITSLVSLFCRLGAKLAVLRRLFCLQFVWGFSSYLSGRVSCLEQCSVQLYDTCSAVLHVAPGADSCRWCSATSYRYFVPNRLSQIAAHLTLEHYLPSACGFYLLLLEFLQKVENKKLHAYIPNMLLPQVIHCSSPIDFANKFHIQIARYSTNSMKLALKYLKE